MNEDVSHEKSPHLLTTIIKTPPHTITSASRVAMDAIAIAQASRKRCHVIKAKDFFKTNNEAISAISNERDAVLNNNAGEELKVFPVTADSSGDDGNEVPHNSKPYYVGPDTSKETELATLRQKLLDKEDRRVKEYANHQRSHRVSVSYEHQSNKGRVMDILDKDVISTSDYIRAFLDVSIGKQPVGRITMELFDSECPNAVNAFCSMLNGYNYVSGTPLCGDIAVQQLVRNQHVLFGVDCFGGSTQGLPDTEPSLKRHTQRGLIALLLKGPELEWLSFIVTSVASKWLDSRSLIIGKVVEGLKVMELIEGLTYGEHTGAPKNNVTVQFSGTLTKVQPLGVEHLTELLDSSLGRTTLKEYLALSKGEYNVDPELLKPRPTPTRTLSNKRKKRLATTTTTGEETVERESNINVVDDDEHQREKNI